MTEPCRVLFHPTLLAHRAAEIARSQGASRLERDACGRPFVRGRGADPLGEAANEPQPLRFAWLIRVIHALGREAGPPMGWPVGNPHPPSPARRRGGDQ